MAEQAPERLPGAVVLVATGAQLAEYELAGVERGHGVQARRHWLAWLLWLLAGCSWLLGLPGEIVGEGVADDGG